MKKFNNEKNYILGLDNLIYEFWDWENELNNRSRWNDYSFRKIISIVKEVYREFAELLDYAIEKKLLNSKIKKEFRANLKKMAEMLDFCLK